MPPTIGTRMVTFGAMNGSVITSVVLAGNVTIVIVVPSTEAASVYTIHRPLTHETLPGGAGATHNVSHHVSLEAQHMFELEHNPDQQSDPCVHDTPDLLLQSPCALHSWSAVQLVLQHRLGLSQMLEIQSDPEAHGPP